jgi:hypothetical protein
MILPALRFDAHPRLVYEGVPNEVVLGLPLRGAKPRDHGAHGVQKAARMT